MKKLQLAVSTALVIGAFFLGRISGTNMDTIDMNKVADIQSNEYGVQITLEDGNGYYWER
ncbi:M42 family metallopeptidase [Clostridium sp. HBUAS56010]|uniref:M42 family metallopeptidase n=1 Tax=Clostridium sp. HBUAS56010 TaxID=2571127 RepID=UPI0011779711|nr:M42 family metallopeptidase [Clostridium sp. HBUAS56010]